MYDFPLVFLIGKQLHRAANAQPYAQSEVNLHLQCMDVVIK